MLTSSNFALTGRGSIAIFRFRYVYFVSRYIVLTKDEAEVALDTQLDLEQQS